MHLRFAIGAALFAFALSSPGASAAQSEDIEEQARRTIEQAVDEYDAGNYPEAQALFRRAHELFPSARTLRGIGMASFEMRHYVAALRSLTASLEETRRPLTDAQRVHVVDLVERTRGFVVTLHVDVDPPAAALAVDGVPIEREANGAILMDPGHHTLSATSEGRRPRSIELDLESGAEQNLTMSLEPLVAARRIIEVRRAPPLPTPHRTALADALLVSGIAAGVLGLLAGGTSVGTGVLAQSDQAELESTCVYGVCPGELQSVRNRARKLAVATDALWISGSILAVASVALLVVQAILPLEMRASAFCTFEGCMATIGGTL
jgi:hypothetical protein